MVSTIAASYGFDVVDLHFYLLHQVHKRMPDGIHWTQDAVRLQLNIILTHYCLSRKIPLPGRDKSNFWKAAQKIADVAIKEGPIDVVKKIDANVDAKRKKNKNLHNFHIVVVILINFLLYTCNV